MKEISRKDLIEILMKSNASEIGLVTETSVTLNKRGNPLAAAKVTKVTSGVYEFGGSFDERLKGELDTSVGADVGEVKTHSLPWGHWYEGAEGKVIEYTNKLGEHHQYIRYYNATSNVVVQYSVNDAAPTDTDLANIKAFLPKKKNTAYVTENCGEVENKTLKTQVVDFNNILLLTIDGMIYKIDTAPLLPSHLSALAE